MKLGRGGMTRLIDVAMIILIGFLAIADLDERTTITLPDSWDSKLDTLDVEKRRLTVTADLGPRYVFELVNSIGMRRALGAVSGTDTLRAVLGRLKDQHNIATIDVKVMPQAPAQAAVDVIDAVELFDLDLDIEFLNSLEDGE
jgi:hypothetical protein